RTELCGAHKQRLLSANNTDTAANLFPGKPVRHLTQPTQLRFDRMQHYAGQRSASATEPPVTCGRQNRIRAASVNGGPVGTPPRKEGNQTTKVIESPAACKQSVSRDGCRRTPGPRTRALARPRAPPWPGPGSGHPR